MKILISAVLLTSDIATSVLNDWFITNTVDSRSSYVFIHACVGIFSKKRGNGTWGNGESILVEMLKGIQSSDIRTTLGGVFIGILGKNQDLINVEVLIQPFVEQLKMQVVVKNSNIELAEFPTLNAMQQFASRVPSATKLAYMHTKGVRKNGIDQYPEGWRRYLQYFIVDRHEICYEALDQFQYCTCGPSKQAKIYAGNFWWTKAGYMASRRPLISDIAWNMDNRYLAEEYLLRNQSSPGPHVCDRPSAKSPPGLHYCIHHAHHPMQLCHTPKEWYENVSSQLRRNPQCFFPKLMPSHPKKDDPYSWCHHDGLPNIPDPP